MDKSSIPYVTGHKKHLHDLELTGHLLLEAGQREAALYGRRHEQHLFHYHESWFGREVRWQLGDEEEHAGLKVVSRPRSLVMDLYTSQRIEANWPHVVHSVGHLTTTACYLESYDENTVGRPDRDFLDPGKPAIDYFKQELADFIDRSGLILAPFEPPIVGYNQHKFDK